MVDFVEQARLIAQDRSSPTLRKINSEIRKLITTMRNADGRRIRVKAEVSNPATFRRQINTLTRRRDLNVSARLNANTARQQIANLTRRREMVITPRVGTATGGAPGARGAAGGDTIGDGIRSGLRPRQIGRDIARGFTFSIQGELFQITRAIVREIGAAPVRLDDAIARARVAGRNDQEITFLREIAELGSRQFQGATEADIIANSGEVVGRFGDLTDPIQQKAAKTAILRLARNIQILEQALPKGGTGGAGNQARLVETAIQQLGATQDPERAAAISRSVLQAIIASGGDLQASDVKRTLQQLPTGRSAVSDDTLLQALLIRDEGGRRSTGNFDQLLSDLIRGNLNKSDKALQRSAEERLGVSVRNDDGSSDLFDAFGRNFLQTVETQIAPLLEARGIELSRENAGQIRSFLDNELGLSKQGGITFLTDALVNLTEAQNEFNRARRTTPEAAITNVALSQELKQVRAQFENLSAAALEPLVPAMKTGLDQISDALNSAQNGEGIGVASAVAIGTAAIPVALGAGLEALADKQTRPLGAASVALTGSAGALTGAAAALKVAAAVGGVGGGRGGRGFFRGIRAAGAGALAASTGLGRRAVQAAPSALRFAGPGVVVAAVTPSQLGDGTLAGSNPEIKDLQEQLFEASQATQALTNALEIRQRAAAIPNLPAAAQTLADDQVTTAQAAVEANRSLIADLTLQLETEINRTLDLQQAAALGAELPSNLELAFGDAKLGFDQSIGQFDVLSTQFGPQAAEALMAVAPLMGQAMGETARQALGQLTFNINRNNPAPALETGPTVLE